MCMYTCTCICTRVCTHAYTSNMISHVTTNIELRGIDLFYEFSSLTEFFMYM